MIDRSNIKDTYFRVLDDGFVSIKDWMGDDFAVEQAARTSYGKGTRKVSETRGLLRYLMRHKHTTPFEMCEMKFHIRIPMDAWRQMVRHRTANINEYSTRYSEAIDSRQVTRPEAWRLQSGSNKQGSEGYLSVREGHLFCQQEDAFHEHAMACYQNRLDAGIAREQARKDLPLSTYTEAYWKCDLHNIFHFLKLRCDGHAQLEIRSYANVMASIVKVLYPMCFEAWYDYAFQAVNFTRLDRQLLTWIMENPRYNSLDGFGVKEQAEKLGMSKREVEEFWNKVNYPDEQEFNINDYEIIQPNDTESTEG